MNNDSWEGWNNDESPGITMTRGEKVALTVLVESGVPMTHGDIARKSGLRTGTVRNRAVRRRRDGWVAMDEGAVLVRMVITAEGRKALLAAGVESISLEQRVVQDDELLQAKTEIGELERLLAAERERNGELEARITSAGREKSQLESQIAKLRAKLNELPVRLQEVLEQATQFTGNEADLYRVFWSVLRWQYRDDETANGLLGNVFLAGMSQPTLKSIAWKLAG